MRHNDDGKAETGMLERATSAQSSPSDCIARARDLAPLIAAHAPRTEQEREIAPEVLAALHEARLFRMLIPHSCGGLEVDPLTFMQAIEELAKADGSTAWCVSRPRVAPSPPPTSSRRWRGKFLPSRAR
jgi:alkylation response protein AidB-like acyl-CoA dehydrogenase